MSLTVHSPHSGLAVKVREADVGRAVRDEAGRIFYVLPRSDGQGFYASTTRAGGPEAEARYDALDKREPADPAAVHDATGRKRSNPRGKLVILLLVLLMLAVLTTWAFTVGPWGQVQWQKPPVDQHGEPVPTQVDDP